MAQLNKNIIGNLKGTVGNVSFRVRNGKNFAMSKPGKHKWNGDPMILMRREKFGITVKFSSSINSIRLLYQVWEKNSSPLRPVFNNLIKVNYHLTGSNGLTSKNIITPLLGFPFSTQELQMDSTRINITTNPLSGAAAFDPAVEFKVKLVMLLYLSDVIEEGGIKYIFLPFESDTRDLQLDDPINFVFDLNGLQQSMYKSFHNKAIYCALVTMDETEKPVHYSTTLHHQTSE